MHKLGGMRKHRLKTVYLLGAQRIVSLKRAKQYAQSIQLVCLDEYAIVDISVGTRKITSGVDANRFI